MHYFKTQRRRTGDGREGGGGENGVKGHTCGRTRVSPAAHRLEEPSELVKKAVPRRTCNSSVESRLGTGK